MAKRQRNSKISTPSSRAALVDGAGEAALLTPTLLRDASVAVLGSLAVLAWLAAHSTEDWAGAAGAAFIVASFALGLVQPTAGLALAIITAPFQGTPIGGLPDAYGVREFVRAAPLWGSLLRTLVDIIRRGRERDAAPRPLLVAALACIVLSLVTRFTSDAYPLFHSTGATGVLVDSMAVVGTQAVMWGAWVLASNLPRRHVPLIERTIAIVLPIAIIMALSTYAEISLFKAFTFNGTTFGRLAGLGYPTPTAMGIAIGLPISAALAWRISKPLGGAVIALALLTIFLTESRGPLLAVIGSSICAIAVYRNVSWRLVALGGLAGGIPAAALAAQRYGNQFAALFSGKGADLLGQSDSTRIASWVAAAQIVVQKPLTGAGWMGLRFWDPLFEKNHVYESHNIILLAVAAGGLPYGGATAVGVIGSSFLLWRNRRRVPIEWLAAVVALLICGLWDMPQTRAFGALYGGIVLGLVARRPIDHADVGQPQG
jgi:hypothetical protein